MPLQPQRVSFPIVGGQEQGIAPELIEPPLLVRAHNVVYGRAGELSKRRGWINESESIANGGYLPPAERLSVRGNEIVWIGEQVNQLGLDRESLGITTRTPAESAEDDPAVIWQRKGQIARWNVMRLAEIGSRVPDERIKAVDCAFAGNSLTGRIGVRGVLGVLWQQGASLYFAAVDVETKSILSTITIDTNAPENESIRVIAIKSSDGDWYFHIFYPNGELETGADIHYSTVPAAKPFVATSRGYIVTNVRSYDICYTGPVGLGIDPNWTFAQRAFFVFGPYEGGTSVVAYLLTPAAGHVLTLSDSRAHAATGSEFVARQLTCCCDPDGRHLWVHCSTRAAGPVYRNEAFKFNTNESPTNTFLDSYNHPFDSTLATATSSYGVQVGWAGTAVVGGVTYYDNAVFTWSKSATYRTDIAECFSTGILGFGGFNTGTSYAYVPWSRHWTYRGRDYFTVIRGMSPDATCLEFVGHWVPPSGGGDPPPMIPEITGRALQGELSHATDSEKYPRTYGRNSIVESWYELGRFFGAFPTVTLDGTDTKISIIEITASDSQRFNSVDSPVGLYIASSIPWCYDGGPGHEMGFAHRPQYNGTSTGEIAVVGRADLVTPLPAGEYWVALCWEMTDDLGRVTRSAPSISSIILPANQSINIYYQPFGYSSHWRAMRPVAYVSNDGGLNYQRSTQVIPHQPGYGAESITIQLNTADLFVLGAPLLYTSQGILENSPPPIARFSTWWANRLWFANGKTVWFSREVVDGEAPEFNEALSFQIPVDCSGLAALDDRLVIFGTDSIYVITGDGPTDTGEGGMFSQPQRMQSDFGCVDARSLVRTEKGVCFRSRRGIEVFNGSGTRIISGGIDRLLKENGYSEVTAASFDALEQICRFVLKGSSDYLIACWHTAFELWTTASVPRVSSLAGRVNVPNGLVYAFERNWLGLNDAASQITSPVCTVAREVGRNENPGSLGQCVDGYAAGGLGTVFWYQSEVEFANIKLDGLQGFQRIWKYYILVRDVANNDTGISLSSANDYSDPYAERVWTTTADISSGVTGNGAHRRYAVHVANQQSSSIKIRFRDMQRTDAAPGKNTPFTLVSLGIEYGIKLGTGRGAPGAKR